MSERPQGHDPDVQLARLGERCRSLAPTLYREQALYLQRVRSLLPTAVKTAIQNLLCALPSDQPEALDEHQLQFQKRIDALLQRSSSLITVEQLLVLSARLKKEERRLRMQQLQALTERASERADATTGLDDATSTPSAASVGVELSLDLPLERPSSRTAPSPLPSSSSRPPARSVRTSRCVASPATPWVRALRSRRPISRLRSLPWPSPDLDRGVGTSSGP